MTVDQGCPLGVTVGCCVRASKTVMKEGGVIRSDAVRHPLEPLHPHTRAGLLELAAEVNPLALRWGR